MSHTRREVGRVKEELNGLLSMTICQVEEMSGHLPGTASDGDYGTDCVVHVDEIGSCFGVILYCKAEGIWSLATDEGTMVCVKRLVSIYRI